jgi:hypothetical protein
MSRSRKRSGKAEGGRERKKDGREGGRRKAECGRERKKDGREGGRRKAECGRGRKKDGREGGRRKAECGMRKGKARNQYFRLPNFHFRLPFAVYIAMIWKESGK